MYKGDDGKMVYDVLDKDSKSVSPKTGDAQEAMKYPKNTYQIKKWQKRSNVRSVTVTPNMAMSPKEIAQDPMGQYVQGRKRRIWKFSKHILIRRFPSTSWIHLRSKFEKDEAT